jgi:hypothetical protein
MFKFLVLSFSLCLTMQANAQSIHQASEATINTLVPTGYTLAQEYMNYNLDPSSGVEGWDTNVSSVVEYDFNNDKILDLALLVEKPVCYNTLADGSCGKESWDWGASDRKLMIYFAQKSGGYKLFLETTSVIMNEGEGGVASRDPLQSFEVNKKGSIELSYWGGSATKWAYTFKVQYRKVGTESDFYVVGITTMYQDWAMDSNDEPTGMMMYVTDKNLITGDIVETTSLILTENEADEKDVVTKSKSKQPLVKLRNATEDFIFGY